MPNLTLKNLVETFGANITAHVATIDGSGWIIKNATTDNSGFACEAMNRLADREVVNIYAHEGRPSLPTCYELNPGLAIIVVGSENGRW